LLLAGALDAASVGASHELATALPRAQVEIIEAAGHVVNLARPREFNTALVAFLESLGSPVRQRS
jgi:pimeloyl-ACP methyl ester carboxylesterase